MELEFNKIYCMDALEGLKKLEDNRVAGNPNNLFENKNEWKKLKKILKFKDSIIK